MYFSTKLEKSKLKWYGLGLYLVIVLALIAIKYSNIRCNEVVISIADSSDQMYIEEKEVISLLEGNGGRIIGAPIDSLNTAELEAILLKQPIFRRAELYKTFNGKLKIDIWQRQPIVRVFGLSNEHFYIDREGAIMPLPATYRPDVIVANGKIKKKSAILQDIWKLALFIDSHEFWKSQIEQIYVTSKLEFELIPRVGSHVIEFGNIENYEYKFRKLEAVYTKALQSVGWNKYKAINVKFSDQVICKK